MDSNYSLADLKAVTDGTGAFGGEGIWVILLILLLFGNGGFGYRNGELNQYATAASQQDILFNQKFDAIGTKLNSIGDGICSLGYDQLRQMDANTSSINGNITNEGRAIQTQLCAINSNIDNKFAALEKSQLEQTIQAQANQINQLALAQQMAGVVKYPMSSSYAMLNNPFCGCGCGCAN